MMILDTHRAFPSRRSSNPYRASNFWTKRGARAANDYRRVNRLKSFKSVGCRVSLILTDEYAGTIYGARSSAHDRIIKTAMNAAAHRTNPGAPYYDRALPPGSDARHRALDRCVHRVLLQPIDH